MCVNHEPPKAAQATHATRGAKIRKKSAARDRDGSTVVEVEVGPTSPMHKLCIWPVGLTN